ncbi:MAG: exo-alpha-sialidase [Bacteroidia bacterium]|nr:exo-alpha-sialidase [Bacteroidia bacterium]
MKSKILILSTIAIFLLLFTNCKKKDKNPEPEPAPATPSPLATLSTLTISSITETTAIGGGNISSEGTSAITAVGVCWDTNTSPTTLKPHTNNGAGTGTYTSSITGLLPNTTYYVRAYATNGSGTVYGNEVSFKTKSIWTKANVTSGNTIFVNSTAIIGSDIFCPVSQSSVTSVIKTSSDNGATWSQVGTTINEGDISIFSNGTELFSGMLNGIYKSTNNSVTWTNSSSGLPTASITPKIKTFTKSGSSIFAGGNIGVFRSTDNGSSWIDANNGLGVSSVIELFSAGSIVFAGTSNDCYRSADNGTSWNTINTGLPLTNKNIHNFCSNGNTILLVAGNLNTLYLSNDNGNTWSIANNSIGILVNAVVSYGNNFYISTFSGVYVSEDNGLTWQNISQGLANNEIKKLLVRGNMLIGFLNGNATYDTYNYPL